MRGTDEAHTFVRLVERHFDGGRDPSGGWQTSLAFLELAQPDLMGALERCALHGAGVIVLIPLFLFRAGHMRVDIPAVVERFGRAHPGIHVELLDAVAYNDVFLQVVARRVRCSVGDDVEDTAVVLLGRGNRDAEARALFLRMGEQLRRQARVRSLSVGYLAGDGIHWRCVLDDLAQTGWRKIQIQPYLWFHGRLTDRLPAQVDEWLQMQPRVERVRIGEPLGTEASLVQEVARRIREVLQEFERRMAVSNVKHTENKEKTI